MSNDVPIERLARPTREDNDGWLFDVEPDWREHWWGMPEFEHGELRPVRSLIVHFDSEESVREFAALVEQTITSETKSLWYPKAEIDRYSDKLYRSVAQ